LYPYYVFIKLASRICGSHPLNLSFFHVFHYIPRRAYKLNTLEPFVKISTNKVFHRNGYRLEAMNGIIEWANRNIKYNYIYYDFNKRKITNKKPSERNIYETMKIIKDDKK
jgi:hypothetical protein